MSTDDYTDDDAYDGDGGFPYYIPTTRDPGPWMIVFSLVFTLLAVLILPALVVWGKQWEQRQKAIQAIRDQIDKQGRKLFDDEEDLEDIDLEYKGTLGPNAYPAQSDVASKVTFDKDYRNNRSFDNNGNAGGHTPRRPSTRGNIISTDQKSAISGMGSTLSGASRFVRQNRTIDSVSESLIMRTVTNTVLIIHVTENLMASPFLSRHSLWCLESME